MRMSLGVNTAEQTLPPLCHTNTLTHTHGGDKRRYAVAVIYFRGTSVFSM